ncbi:hypothetical protein HBH56_208020 [Parastagonospora nodorum]|uniref:Uncharacterized protein n=1 Tax=Phaeosphaeria nodorum (strain SN15 / ATCC MYA-4574 / FGSC 10173) TaxID=321614 RepID=A0A7U2FAV6_PHANO|nr:hypothetical protein HBH56_208020 [Parastagonospora nodorum]QRC99589.1 hypothetical protein JI435_413620 [Parastagonospora nodorum SN15]KAH3923603.1 hypothetical protein HBH54_206890 [Parastagonospora nodorum]KAH3941600.1 hypothetical protein HBH53_199940 [Parastagonospora nodorum]KAH3960372.1 hypothetical protein HBH51_191410 [Parastagonospora nodorum]
MRVTRSWSSDIAPRGVAGHLMHSSAPKYPDCLSSTYTLAYQISDRCRGSSGVVGALRHIVVLLRLIRYCCT